MKDLELLEQLGALERYLSAKEQIAAIGKGAETMLAWKNAVHAAGDAIKKNMSTVAAPIVRCRDCAEWDASSGLTARKCEIWDKYTIQDEFCSRGKKVR